ncbi:MAG: type II toxin-antitoxin system VapC family toxin [Opitutales bacterium]
MVIVDTSVWIDLFKGRESGPVAKLEQLLAEEVDVFTTGLIVQEVLSGIKSGKEREQVRTDLGHFILVMPTLDTHAHAAEIFGTCRKKGYTIRSIVDCLVAALAFEYDLEIHENDRDYRHIAQVFPLRIVGSA